MAAPALLWSEITQHPWVAICIVLAMQSLAVRQLRSSPRLTPALQALGDAATALKRMHCSGRRCACSGRRGCRCSGWS